MTQDIVLTNVQQDALNQIKTFISNPNKKVFILRGYAGTGKTTLMRFIIPYLKEKSIEYKLLATTGRAAKVLSNYSGYETSTIHHLIYSFNNLNKDLSDITESTNIDDTGQLYLNFDPVQNDSANPCVYIIDESSMIADEFQTQIIQAKFGTGKLLTELFNYDNNPSSKFIFVGDPCQLPPINSPISPALEPDYISNVFRFGVEMAELTQIMRQSDDNDIISTASLLRILYVEAPNTQDDYDKTRPTWGFIPFRNRNNIVLHSTTQDLINDYVIKFLQHGYDKTIYIARSNSQCRKVCDMVRSIKGFKDDLCVGDILMVYQNQLTTGLMNGDFVEVLQIGNKITQRFYTGRYTNPVLLSFVEVKVKECFTQREHTSLLILECLHQDNLDSIQQSGLFLDFALRMQKQGITQKKNINTFNDMMQKDPILNALRCSYGYAVTCHKAQGGEWDEVYVDMPRNITKNPTKSTFQWIYTALTRARQTLHCVDDFYIKDENEYKKVTKHTRYSPQIYGKAQIINLIF